MTDPTVPAASDPETADAGSPPSADSDPAASDPAASDRAATAAAEGAPASEPAAPAPAPEAPAPAPEAPAPAAPAEPAPEPVADPVAAPGGEPAAPATGAPREPAAGAPGAAPAPAAAAAAAATAGLGGRAASAFRQFITVPPIPPRPRSPGYEKRGWGPILLPALRAALIVGSVDNLLSVAFSNGMLKYWQAEVLSWGLFGTVGIFASTRLLRRYKPFDIGMVALGGMLAGIVTANAPWLLSLAVLFLLGAHMWAAGRRNVDLVMRASGLVVLFLVSTVVLEASLGVAGDAIVAMVFWTTLLAHDVWDHEKDELIEQARKGFRTLVNVPLGPGFPGSKKAAAARKTADLKAGAVPVASSELLSPTAAPADPEEDDGLPPATEPTIEVPEPVEGEQVP